MGSFEEPKMATFRAMKPNLFEGAVTFICISDLTEYVLRIASNFHWVKPFTQSICTLYSCFENTGWFVTVTVTLFE